MFDRLTAQTYFNERIMNNGQSGMKPIDADAELIKAEKIKIKSADLTLLSSS